MERRLFTGATALVLAALIGLSLGGMSKRSLLAEDILSGAHRSDEERARDKWRHPAETLDFFGLEADMTVAEIWPGGAAWYLKVIAPSLATGGGTYIAVTPWDPESENERVQGAIARFNEAFVAHPETYGAITTSLMRGAKNDIAPEGSVDMVLTFRNVHNWMTGDPETDYSDEYMAAFFKALKPGGILGVVEHAADPGVPVDPAASSGYTHVSQVKAMAKAAGFEYVSSGDMNANPADTKDHPFGVWTLPPSKRSAGRGAEPAADFDRAKYDAIGESDRMTLKFRKPWPVDVEGKAVVPQEGGPVRRFLRRLRNND